MIPIAIGNAQKESLSQYDKEKYREMILDASETVLGLFGFDRTVYSQFKKKEIGKWYDELREQTSNYVVSYSHVAYFIHQNVRICSCLIGHHDGNSIPALAILLFICHLLSYYLIHTSVQDH